MVEDRDHLSTEVSVEARLDESGLKASAKLRTFAAIDRLVGGIIDLPAAYVDGIAQKRRLRDAIDQEQMRQTAAVATQGQTELQNLEMRAIVQARSDEIRRYGNREAIVIEAIEEISSVTEDDSSVGEIPMDEDWLNVFGDYAERASSDALRSLWAKILAGEIRKPGSFSLTTLRVLSEIDKTTADLFIRVVKGLINQSFLMRPHVVKGDDLIDLATLEECGLLQEANGNIGVDLKFDKDGELHQIFGDKIVIATGVPGQPVRISIAKITRAGQEILRLMPPEDSSTSAERFIDYALRGANTIAIADISHRHANGSINYTNKRVVPLPTES